MTRILSTLAVVLGTIALGAGARGAPIGLDEVAIATIAPRIYVQDSERCPGTPGDRPDLALASASIAPPAPDGTVALDLTIRAAVGAGEVLPPTRAEIRRDDEIVVVFELAGITSINNKCPAVEGSTCAAKCRTTGCDGGRGVCSCEPTGTGSETRCKCVRFLDRTLAVSGRPGDRIRIDLDAGDAAIESDECNNGLDLVVP